MTPAALLLSNSGDAFQNALREVVERVGETPTVLFGGAIRSVLCGKSVKDLDFVVSRVSNQELRQMFRDVPRHMTAFGGMHLNIKGVPVDIWPLNSTWAFNEAESGSGMSLIKPSFDSLMMTTCFNIEAVAVSATKTKIYDGGFAEALRTRVLEFNYVPNPWPLLVVVRAAVLCKQYKMMLGPKLKKHVHEHGTSVTIETLMSVLSKRYDRDGWIPITVDELEDFIHQAGK